MSDSVATLSVDIIAKDQVSAVLTKLDAQLDRTNQSASRAGRGIGQGIGAGTRQASDSTLQLAQAQARLLSTTGDNQGAFNTLSGALANSTGNQLQNVRASTQLAQIQNRLSGQSQTLTSLFQNQGQTISALGGQLSALGGTAGSVAGNIGNLAGSFGTLGGIGAAIGLGKVVVDLSLASAKIDATRTSFDNLARSAGTTGDVLLSSLRAAAKGTVSDAQLIESANSGILLTGGKLATDLPRLLEIARASAQASGDDIGFVFDSLVKGIARGSPQIIDNAKITLDAAGAFETYARSIGKAPDQLSRAEQQQATLNAVLAAGTDIIAKTGGGVETNAAIFARFGTNVENTKNSLGSFFSGGLAPLAQQFNQTSEATASLIGWFQNLGAASSQSAAELAASTASNNAYATVLAQTGDTAQAAQAAELTYAAVLAQTGPVVAGVTDIEQQRLNVRNQLAGLTPQVASAELGYANALEMTGVQARAAEVAARQKADADQVAAVNAQTHTVAQQALAQQAQLAAATLLASGGAGASAASVLAGSSSQVDILTAAYYRLAAAQAAAGQAATKAALAKQTPRQLIGADSERAGIQASKHDAVVTQRAAQVKASQEAAAAERNYQQTLGNTGPALAHARSELAQLTAGSAAYINKQNEIAQLQQRADAAAKKGKGGGGAGAVKLTDQQKLNNSLLASQDTYAQKSEDAEQAHFDRILSIQADFAKKAQAAQDVFGQDQLDSRASFYDSLGGIEDAGLRSALSAQYEQAFAEAQQIATTKGADVADAFLKAKQSALQAQAQRASEIAQATKEGDKDKAAYLEGVDKLYREAEDRKVAAAAAGNDSIAAERDAALAEEGQKYSDAQAKIGDSADQAAERKIAAAERSGAAVDAEKARVDALKTSYDSLGAAGSRTPSTTAPAPTTTPTDATAAPTPAPTDLAAALSSLAAAQAAIERAVREAGKGVEGAVGKLAGSFAR